MFSENLLDMLRALSAGLQTPVIVFLLLLAAVVLIMLGALVVEFFTEKNRLKAKLPRLMDDLKRPEADIAAMISNSGLLRRQRELLLELTAHPELTPITREALARRLIYQEQAHYDRITKITDAAAKLGPMLGLLGTLIPLGPGLIALGQGDTYTLSRSLLTAFDTTVAGLAVAALAYSISGIRKGWYENYMTATEALAVCLLDREGGGNE
jgi:biopolymer transport protein ExbB/TolQ